MPHHAVSKARRNKFTPFDSFCRRPMSFFAPDVPITFRTFGIMYEFFIFSCPLWYDHPSGLSISRRVNLISAWEQGFYEILCSVDRASRYNSCKWPTWHTVLFSYMFIPNLYMFRALMCSSSGQLIVSIRHLVYVTVCRWPSGMQVCVEPKPAYQTVTYIQWHIPDVVLIQLILLMMSTGVLETCRDL